MVKIMVISTISDLTDAILMSKLAGDVRSLIMGTREVPERIVVTNGVPMTFSTYTLILAMYAGGRGSDNCPEADGLLVNFWSKIGYNPDAASAQLLAHYEKEARNWAGWDYRPALRARTHLDVARYHIQVGTWGEYSAAGTQDFMKPLEEVCMDLWAMENYSASELA